MYRYLPWKFIVQRAARAYGFADPALWLARIRKFAQPSEVQEPIELVRLIATTRIAFPKARVRLSAGRDRMSPELQALCFVAGANSIFFGDKLLTAPNPSAEGDAELFRAMGLPVLIPARGEA